MAKGDDQALKDACQKVGKQSTKTRLKTGETSTFCGLPAYSEDGTLALQVGEHTTLIFQEGDVQDVEKSGKLYLVRVPVSAHVLYRYEAAVMADPKRGSCGCADGGGHDDTGDVAAMRPRWPAPGTILDIPIPPIDWNDPGRCFQLCLPGFKCVPYRLDDGTVVQICFPVLNCETLCGIEIP